jgi:hypothetical protein
MLGTVYLFAGYATMAPPRTSRHLLKLEKPNPPSGILLVNQEAKRGSLEAHTILKICLKGALVLHLDSASIIHLLASLLSISVYFTSLSLGRPLVASAVPSLRLLLVAILMPLLFLNPL